MTGPRVLVVGDVINDILVEPAGPVTVGEDNPASVRVRPGGSAANQAAWLGSLGIEVVFAGRVGARDAELHRAELARFGVSAQLATDPVAGTGSIVVLVGADGERTMITDRGANLALAAGDVPAGLLDEVASLHLTGYTLVTPGPRAVALGLIARARRRGLPVTIDPGSAAFLARLRPGEFIRWTRGAAVCFPNRDEAALLSGRHDPAAMAGLLAAHYPVVALKLGPDGALLATRDHHEQGLAVQRFAARPAAAVRDTTGAGDAFCAGFLAAWLRGASEVDAMRAAASAAGIAVAILGGRPAPEAGQATGDPRNARG